MKEDFTVGKNTGLNLNWTISWVLSSAKMAKNQTELDFGNYTVQGLGQGQPWPDELILNFTLIFLTCFEWAIRVFQRPPT